MKKNLRQMDKMSKRFLHSFITWIVVGGSLFLAGQAYADALPELKARLSDKPLIHGDFKQIRSMEMFNDPLVSSGTFLLVKEKGLLWKQTAPFPVSLTLTQKKLRQQFGDQPAKVVLADENPMMFYFSHVFLSLFNGDTQQLEDQFTLKFKQDKKDATTWTLVLTPKGAPLSSVFKHIEIQGDDFINRLLLTEIRGDITEILFMNQSVTPLDPVANESDVFKF